MWAIAEMGGTVEKEQNVVAVPCGCPVFYAQPRATTGDCPCTSPFFNKSNGIGEFIKSGIEVKSLDFQ